MDVAPDLRSDERACEQRGGVAKAHPKPGDWIHHALELDGTDVVISSMCTGHVASYPDVVGDWYEVDTFVPNVKGDSSGGSEMDVFETKWIKCEDKQRCRLCIEGAARQDAAYVDAEDMDDDDYEDDDDVNSDDD